MNASAAELVVGADHPAFAGHFPGHPVLPGVVLLAEAIGVVMAATRTRACDWTLESAKFHAPVGPGTRLAITHSTSQAGRVRFEIRAGDALVASGALTRAAGAHG